MYACLYVCMYVCICVCVCACVHACRCVRADLCAHRCMVACLHVWMRVCVCIHVCVVARADPAHASVCARAPRAVACVCVTVRARLSACACNACVSARVCAGVSLYERFPCAALLPAGSDAASVLCSSASACCRVRPDRRIRARQRRRNELPVGNGHRANSSRLPEGGGRGGEALRRRGPSRWSAGGVLLAQSRCRKLLLQQRSRPKQRVRAARVRRCARVQPLPYKSGMLLLIHRCSCVRANLDPRLQHA
jgi:hypothetical protein